MIDASEGKLAVGDRLLRGRLERDADNFSMNQALCEGVVDNRRNFAASRGRALGQVVGTEPEDAVKSIEAKRDLGHADALVLDDEVADGDRVGVFLPREESRAVEDFLQHGKKHGR